MTGGGVESFPVYREYLDNTEINFLECGIGWGRERTFYVCGITFLGGERGSENL